MPQYNGCKWLGGVLRVEVAKPDFRARFEAEELTEREQRQHAEADAAQLATVLPPGPGDRAAAPPLRILRRDGTKVLSTHMFMETPHKLEVTRRRASMHGIVICCVVSAQTMKVEPNKARTFFPPVRQRAAKELSWDEPPPPPGFARLERVLNAASAAQQPRRPASAAVDGTPGARVAAAAALQEPHHVAGCMFGVCKASRCFWDTTYRCAGLVCRAFVQTWKRGQARCSPSSAGPGCGCATRKRHSPCPPAGAATMPNLAACRC